MMKLWYLTKINALEDLTDEEMREIDSNSIMKDYRKNSFIYSGSEVSGNVYLLKKGMVKIYKVSNDGQELTLQILNAGDVFGDLFPMQKTTGYNEAKTISDVKLCLIKKKTFFKVLMRNQKAFIRLNEELGRQLNELEELLSMFVFKSIDKRVCFILKKIYDKFGNGMAAMKLTHRELANMVGAARETTTGVLDKLRSLGVIDLRRGSINIKNVERLSEIEECGLNNNHTK